MLRQLLYEANIKPEQRFQGESPRGLDVLLYQGKADIVIDHLARRLLTWDNLPTLKGFFEYLLAVAIMRKWERRRDDMPEEHKFERLAPSRKRLTDTVKLVAYRAETMLAMILREKLSDPDEARALVRDLLRSDADLYPNQDRRVLEVRIHTLANPRSNRAAQHLLEQLNAAEFTYPGTNLRLTYTLSSPPTGPAEVPP